MSDKDLIKKILYFDITPTWFMFKYGQSSNVYVDHIIALRTQNLAANVRRKSKSLKVTKLCLKTQHTFSEKLRETYAFSSSSSAAASSSGSGT